MQISVSDVLPRVSTARNISSKHDVPSLVAQGLLFPGSEYALSVSRATDAAVPHGVRLVAAGQILLEDALRDAVATVDDLRLLAEIAETDDDFPVVLHIAVIVRVDDADAVSLRDALADAETRTDVELQHLVGLHECLDARVDFRRTIRCDGDCLRRREVVASSIARRSVRQDDALVLEATGDLETTRYGVPVVKFLHQRLPHSSNFFWNSRCLRSSSAKARETASMTSAKSSRRLPPSLSFG